MRAFLEGQEKKIDGLLNALQKSEVWSKITNVMSTKKETERVQGFENMAAAQRVPEAADPVILDFYPGFSQAFTQHQWGARSAITKPMKEFAQYELIDRLNKHLPLATHKVRELIANAYLEYGHTTSPTVGGAPLVNTTGSDATYLFSATHPFKTDSRTWSNYSASGASLTETNVNTVVTAIRRWTDNTGAPLDINAMRLIIPEDLRASAAKLTQSSLEPGTANNAINTIPAILKSETMTSQWLSDTNDWYIETDADNEEFGIQFKFGWRDQIRRYTEDSNETDFISITFSLAHGVNQLRRFYKQTGA